MLPKFDRYGDPSAKAAVLLHGLSSSRSSFREVIDHLSSGPIARGEVQAINVDLRGHGSSGWASLEQYDAPSFAADIVELIETEIGAPSLLVGHSLGGVVAGAVAALRPELVRGMFLEDPPYFEGDAEVRNASPVASFFPKMIAAVLTLHERHAPVGDYAALIADMTAPEYLAERAQGLMFWDPMTMQAAVDGVVWQGFDPEAKVLCPLTILLADPACGSVFKEADATRVSATIPHARMVLVPGAAHGIHAGATLAVYLRELDDFLAST